MGVWSPFVRPESERIALPAGVLPEGQWIECKKYLSVKEQRAVFDETAGLITKDGERRPNYKLMGIAEMAAYVLAWSFTDTKGESVPVTIDAIGALRDDVYDVLDTALDAHKEKMQKERDERKNVTVGAIEPSAISSSAA